jgi:hypothetical protein
MTMKDKERASQKLVGHEDGDPGGYIFLSTWTPDQANGSQLGPKPAMWLVTREREGTHSFSGLS